MRKWENENDKKGRAEWENEKRGKSEWEWWKREEQNERMNIHSS